MTGHDGCWHTTTAGNEFSVTLDPDPEWELGFTPDDIDERPIAAVLTISLALLVGFILGRVL